MKTLLEKQEDTLTYIEEQGGCTKNQLYAHLKYSRNVMSKVLLALVEKEAIEKKEIGKIHWYYMRKNDRRTKRPTRAEKAWGVEILRP
jgi:uncharacterized membrane protein